MENSIIYLVQIYTFTQIQINIEKFHVVREYIEKLWKKSASETALEPR